MAYPSRLRPLAGNIRHNKRTVGRNYSKACTAAQEIQDSCAWGCTLSRPMSSVQHGFLFGFSQNFDIISFKTRNKTNLAEVEKCCAIHC